MFSPDLRLLKPLEEYIECLEKLNSRSLPLVCEMFSSDAVYQDPYHRAHGIDQIEALLKEKLNWFTEYRVQDFAWGRKTNQAYVFWSCGEVQGVTLLSFMPDRSIMSAQEFWHSMDVSKSYKKFKL